MVESSCMNRIMFEVDNYPVVYWDWGHRCPLDDMNIPN